MKEVWKPIKEYEGLYEVSNLGRVNSLKGNIIIKPALNKGYLRLVLYKNGKKKNKTIHQLVAEAFVDNPNNYSCINHINEIKTDNRVENLEWCDNNYNDNYGTRNERIAKGLSKKIVQLDSNNNYIKTWENASDVERMIGINQGNIRSCCKNIRKSAGGYIWKYHSEYIRGDYY